MPAVLKTMSLAAMWQRDADFNNDGKVDALETVAVLQQAGPNAFEIENDLPPPLKEFS